MRRFAYTYDESGNRASQLDVTPSKAIKWEYLHDWLDRLVTVKRAEAATVGALPGTLPTVSIYTFDESDNRIEFELPQDNVTLTYVVDDADNLVSQSSQEGSDPVVLVESYTHDEDGNMTSLTDEITNEVISFEWDDFVSPWVLPKVRLLHVSSDVSGRKQDNRYHTEGIRKRKLDINDDCSNEYAAGISTALSKAATMSSSSPTISYVMGHQLLGYEEDGDFRFFLTDALGSVRDIVDDDGLVLKSYEFNEYGEQIASSGTGTNSPKTFVGALSVNDDTADSGLFLMGHRHYRASLGRFISRDPIGFAGGLHLQSYPTNPVKHVDPSGLKIRLTGPSPDDIKKFAEYISQATGTNYSCDADGYLSRQGGSTNSPFSFYLSLAVADQNHTTEIRVESGSSEVNFGLARGQLQEGAGSPYDNVHRVDIADLSALIAKNSHVGLGKVAHETHEAVVLSRYPTLKGAQDGYKAAHKEAIDFAENGCHAARGSGYFRNRARNNTSGRSEEFFGPLDGRTTLELIYTQGVPVLEPLIIRY